MEETTAFLGQSFAHNQSWPRQIHLSLLDYHKTMNSANNSASDHHNSLREIAKWPVIHAICGLLESIMYFKQLMIFTMSDHGHDLSLFFLPNYRDADPFSSVEIRNQ